MATQITQDFSGQKADGGTGAYTIVNAPAGLPFLPLGAQSAGPNRLPDPNLQPPKSAVYVGGKGGGAESGGAFDPAFGQGGVS